ncbi:hypothetical protein CNECB9_360009 [Cupriavidus necator]|uniref:Uncharacterized protein n=1 Tax=Cupriavidus necator TaxID=106590 RepID=A0A1K0IIA9_CUPNE|nr:hypothetical protein CNECB9_360009 [Cupriavidus necator]
MNSSSLPRSLALGNALGVEIPAQVFQPAQRWIGAAVPQVFAALMSYGLAVKVLQEVFPLAVANALIPHGLPDNVYTC